MNVLNVMVDDRHASLFWQCIGHEALGFILGSVILLALGRFFFPQLVDVHQKQILCSPIDHQVPL